MKTTEYEPQEYQGRTKQQYKDSMEMIGVSLLAIAALVLFLTINAIFSI